MAGELPRRNPSRRAIGITTDTFVEMSTPSASNMSSSHQEAPVTTLAMAFAQASARLMIEDIPSRTTPEHEIPSCTTPEHSEQYEELQCERQQLPVWKYKKEFLEHLEKNQVITVEGETGCGKTTQIPQWSVEYTNRKQAVGCTQPRRVAATSIAKRVAQEMDVKVGEDVGYRIRFDNCTSQKTVLTYMTEGVLLRLFASNPMLHGYGVILLDECHERGVFVDVLMGLLLDVVRRRPDIRLVIMSATINIPKFKEYFGYPPILSIPGRTHDIKLIYTEQDEWDFVKASVKIIIHIHVTEERGGDILVFAPGIGEIEKICGELESWNEQMNRRYGKLCILRFYSLLAEEEKDLVFEPAPYDSAYGISRKVIVATNIAETSITINGVVFVIDSGYMNMKFYNRKTRVEHIRSVRTTQTNARQRAGRAGRTQPGTCYRLYTEKTYNMMEPFLQPEVLRSNLSSIVLDLKDMKIEDPLCFNFMDHPGTVYCNLVFPSNYT